MTSGWRLAGAFVACLLVVAALVVWRSTQLTGGWLLALQLTGALAVLGLLGAAGWAVLLGTGRANGEPVRREVLLRVTEGEGGLATEVVPSPVRDSRGQRRPALLALAALVPVLLVLVLATPAGAADAEGQAVTDAPVSAASSEPATSAPTAPGPTSAPGTSAPPTTAPPAVEPPPAAEPPQPAVEPPAPGGSPGTCPASVRRGDTLWDLAAVRLGRGATAAAIDAAWRADYAANRDVVGPDPDLILPGQVLSLPCG